MLEFLVTAAVACSAGFVMGGLVSSAKVLALYDRLSIAERTIEEQTALVRDLTNTMRDFLGAAEARMAGSIGAETLSVAQGSLAKSDAFLTRLERTHSGTV